MAKGGSGIVHILFIPTAVAEGRLLRQGYTLYTLYTLYNLYNFVFRSKDFA